jgi:hypothetical protein
MQVREAANGRTSRFAGLIPRKKPAAKAAGLLIGVTKKVVPAFSYIPAVLYITGIQCTSSTPSPYAQVTLQPSAEYERSKTTTIDLGFLFFFYSF